MINFSYSLIYHMCYQVNRTLTQGLQKQSEEILCLKDQAEVKFKLCIILINKKV